LGKECTHVRYVTLWREVQMEGSLGTGTLKEAKWEEVEEEEEEK
jgi:hypothetical protein